MDAMRHEMAQAEASGKSAPVPATPENMKALFSRLGAMKPGYRTTKVK